MQFRDTSAVFSIFIVYVGRVALNNFQRKQQIFTCSELSRGHSFGKLFAGWEYKSLFIMTFVCKIRSIVEYFTHMGE